MAEDSPFSKAEHIGVVVRNMDRAVEYYESLGIGPFKPLNHKLLTQQEMLGKPVEPDSFALKTMQAKLGSINIELLEPIKGESLWKEFLETNGEGIMHLAFFVDDIDREEAKLVEKGLTVLYHVRFQTGGGSAYFDTRKCGGLVIELVQWAPGMIQRGERVEGSPFSNLHHIGLVVRDIDTAINYYEYLGFGPFETLKLPGERTEQIQHGKPVAYKLKNSGTHIGTSTIEFEFIQPVERAAVQEEFLRKRGEGANHLGFKVDDVDKEVEKLEKKGVKVILSTSFTSGIKGKYIDTSKIGSVIVEFWQPPVKT